jgi:hypothetical protein
MWDKPALPQTPAIAMAEAQMQARQEPDKTTSVVS